MNLYFKYCVGACFITSTLTFAMVPQTQDTQQRIEKIYHNENEITKKYMIKRVKYFSQLFLGQPYKLFSLGEGENAPYDQNPRYRIDGFDCETFVDTVLALSLATDFKGFTQCMDTIRYEQKPPQFITRNHFTDLNLNTHLQKRRILKDVTFEIKNKAHHPIAKIAVATIDRPSWYAHMDINRIYLPHASKALKEQRLKALQKEGQHLTIEKGKIPYLPLSELFDNKGKPNTLIFNQIPDGAIIEIVRPNWDLKDKIGTHLNVSHLGFAIKKNKVLYFREASSEFNRVVDVPLIDYLAKALKSPTIKGINVQTIVPQTAAPELCQ